MDEDYIFKNDPVYMKSLIGKRVKITTVDAKSHEGITYVIDPIYKTLVLTDEEGGRVDIFPYQSLKTFEVVSDNIVSNKFIAEKQTSSEIDLTKRKQMVKLWLHTNLINITEVGMNLKLEDILVIEPPYGPDQCLSSNATILERIQNILKSMPDD